MTKLFIAQGRIAVGANLTTGEKFYWFWCPGCLDAHMFAIGGPNGWAWDNNEDEPTFSPSLLVHPNPPVPATNYPGTPKCHLFLQRGKLVFCADSTHALAGRTVDLSPLPEWLK